MDPTAPFSAVDIQDIVIARLTVNPLLTSPLFLDTGTGGDAGRPAPQEVSFGPILDDDPGKAEPGQTLLALHLLGEGERDATMGGREAGTRYYASYFAALCYVGEANRDPAGKRQLGMLTRRVREALMQIRSDPTGGQLWYKNQFKRPVATLYQKGSAFRRSITFIEFYSKLRN